jgi:hypothetical protein
MRHHRESKHTRDVSEVLRAQGAVVLQNVAGIHATIGRADRTVYHRRWCGELELKGPETPVTAKQLHLLAEVELRQPGRAVMARVIALETLRLHWVRWRQTPGEGRVSDTPFEPVLIGECKYYALLEQLEAHQRRREAEVKAQAPQG